MPASPEAISRSCRIRARRITTLQGWRASYFDSTKYQIHITHLKSVTFGFASGRSASQRSLWLPDDMSSKLDTVYCILVVATAVLVGIIKCTKCGNDKSP